MPSYFFSKARPLFLSFANLFFLKCNLTSHGFLLSFFSHPRAPFFSPRCSPYFFCAIASALSEKAELFSALTVNLASLLWTPEFRNSAPSESNVWEITHTQQFFNIFHAAEDVIHETNTVFLYSHIWIRGTVVPDFQKSGCYANTVNPYATATKSCTLSIRQFKFSTAYSQLAVPVLVELVVGCLLEENDWIPMNTSQQYTIMCWWSQMAP